MILPAGQLIILVGLVCLGKASVFRRLIEKSSSDSSAEEPEPPVDNILTCEKTLLIPKRIVKGENEVTIDMFSDSTTSDADEKRIPYISGPINDVKMIDDFIAKMADHFAANNVESVHYFPPELWKRIFKLFSFGELCIFTQCLNRHFHDSAQRILHYVLLTNDNMKYLDGDLRWTYQLYKNRDLASDAVEEEIVDKLALMLPRHIIFTKPRLVDSLLHRRPGYFNCIFVELAVIFSSILIASICVSISSDVLSVPIFGFGVALILLIHIFIQLFLKKNLFHRSPESTNCCRLGGCCDAED